MVSTRCSTDSATTVKSDLPSAAETIALLERFHNGARSFAEREKGLERARQLRASGLRQTFEENRAAIESRHKAAVAAVREEAAGRIARIDEILRLRRIRLDRGGINVRNQVVGMIQAREGQHRAALQRDYMEAGRRREQSLAAAAADYEEQSAATRSIQTRFLKLEKAAVRGLGGYGSLQKRFLLALKETETPRPWKRHEETLESELERRHAQLSKAVRALRSSPFASWFSKVPLILQVFLFLGIGAALPFAGPAIGLPPMAWPLPVGIAAALSAATVAAWMAGRSVAARFVAENTDAFTEAKELRLGHRESVEVRHRLATEDAESQYNRVKSGFEQGLKERPGAGSSQRYPNPEAVERRTEALRAKLDPHRGILADTVHQWLAAEIDTLEHQKLEALSRLDAEHAEEEDPAAPMDRLAAEWSRDFLPVADLLDSESGGAVDSSGGFNLHGAPSDWRAPSGFRHEVPFATVAYHGKNSDLLLPGPDRFPLTTATDFRVPLRLRIPDAASLLIETKQQGREDAIALLNHLVLAWLAASPPGRLSFSLIDPVGLGESFAGLMHLADYEEILINTRIRTQPDQIERRLGELCDHMEKVIQMYLRNDYATITDYNRAAGTIAERYHFLVVADFPHGFTELAARRLLSIAASGARCGVFLLIHQDLRGELPQSFRIDDLRKACFGIHSGMDGFGLRDAPFKGLELTLAKPPKAAEFAEWTHRLGAANRDSNRIEVPFSFIAPSPEECWSLSTANELRVPIGRSGATKLQYLSLGKGTCQHALIAGKTGSGKSTLFHIIISNLALWSSPDEVEFYLIDFKKGVEFKSYADHRLPHARVIAIESDREFGLSVLQRLDEELRHRGELFRSAGVQDVAGYRAQTRAKMPRTLLLIDEFQEFFTEDDTISQQAAVLLDRIVRQGRAFGIHAVLGSQTLGGAFTLARATLGQMTVRIALACNEADAYLIMDDSNPAPRLLTRPGEGIYNDRAGAAEANSPFQVVWLDESERDQLLEHVAALDHKAGSPPRERVVFEGNAPADVAGEPMLESRDPATTMPVIYLGAPNAIKGPTEIRFPRQSGSHLLIVGPREDVVDSLVAVSLRTLRRQYGDRVRLVLIDNRFNGPDSSPFRTAVEAIVGVECPDAHGMADVLRELSAEVKAAADGARGADAPPVFLFIPGLQKHRKLRHEEDFSFSMDEDAEVKPSDALQEIILEGPTWGFHVVASVDSYQNVQRTLGRKAAGEFENKVLFQMSATDSATLIDSGKAADLGLNRALAANETSGEIEIFRPWSMPPQSWFERS